MLHILVTNDDGVFSDGLLALKQALEAVGRVSVIAPDRNRSAIGRGITIHDPLHIEEVELADGSTALATDGTPVDCVRFATLGLLDQRPDVVCSGINLGLNLGDDVTYSGTVAAAIEGIVLGWPAIAVSAESRDPDASQWDGRAYDFAAAARVAARLVAIVTQPEFPPGVLLNVNAPGVAPERLRDARVTRLGRRVYDDELNLEWVDGRRRRFTIYGNTPSYQPEEGTDVEAVLGRRELSVTPMHFDLTDLDGMGRLERLRVADLLAQELAPVEPA